STVPVFFDEAAVVLKYAFPIFRLLLQFRALSVSIQVLGPLLKRRALRRQRHASSFESLAVPGGAILNQNAPRYAIDDQAGCDQQKPIIICSEMKQRGAKKRSLVEVQRPLQSIADLS